MTESFAFADRAGRRDDVPFESGQSIGAALWRDGVRALRTTRVGDRPRGVFCGIGVCHDCLVVVDGRPDQRACATPATSGMFVTAQVGQPAPSTPDGLGSQPAAEELTGDVVVVGAGPAGMSAAVAAERLGAEVLLLDSEARPGGQYWRHGPAGVGRHHHRLDAWRELREAFDAALAGRLRYLPRHRVWRVDRLGDNDFDVLAVRPESNRTDSDRPDRNRAETAGPDGAERLVRARGRALVLATGAHDKVRPFPGWDLPGVLTAGGAQALLEEHEVIAGRRVVVAGTGPFLISLAAGLAQAGAEVVAVYEAGNGSEWLRRWRAAAALPALMAEGAQYAAALSRHRVPVRPRHLVVAARGREQVEGVEVARIDGQSRIVPGSSRWVACDTLAIGWGFVPRLELAQQAGCPVGTSTTIGPAAGAAIPADLQGRTAVPGAFVAGEIAGVGGARLAQLGGGLAGAAAAGFALGLAVAPDSPALVSSRRLAAFAAALHSAHPVPSAWQEALTDETTLCRCEEVDVGTVRDAVRDLGAHDPRTAKLLTRCGMGWCQGRICGESVAAVVARTSAEQAPAAQTRGEHPGSVGGVPVPDRRPIAAPVLLSTLAAITEDPPEDEGESP